MLQIPICETYWLVFLDNDRVWPKSAIKSTHAPDQEIRIVVAIPREFSRGKLLLACVSAKTSKVYSEWLRQGRDSPLAKSERATTVLSSKVTMGKGE